MKRILSVALATWMLEHLTFGSRKESLSGDLLEELQSGRSVGWYWRQALSAIAVSLSSKSRAYVLPLLFSAGWSMLYPVLWPSILHSRVTQTVLERMAERDWPYSSAMQGVSVNIPAAMFVWIGFFVYLTLRSQMGRQLSRLRLLVSLSISFNVLFIAIIGEHLSYSGIDLGNVSQKNFDSHFVAISIPLALSLFSALVCALATTQRQYSGANSLAG
jgi:hypothetical protein